MREKLTRYGWLVFLLQLIFLSALFLASPAGVSSTPPAAVLTQHNDNARTGANLLEFILNKSNVNMHRFGKLFVRSVDGQIYAQPLYVPAVAIPGKGTHNVIYVVTEHNTVYAFDADDPDENAPLWQKNLGNSAPLPSSDIANLGYKDMQIEVGVTSTPVIEPVSKTLYVVALTDETSASCKSGCTYAHRLHALDLTDGTEKFGGPVVIAGSVPGTLLQTLAPFRDQPSPNPSRLESPQGLVTFNSQRELQRPGLLLENGVIYVAFGSYGDAPPYHGWVFGYDAQTLDNVSIFNTTPNGAEGAIWQSGNGLAADSGGQIYTITGNGTFSDTLENYGNSFLKLDPSGVVTGELPVAAWFTPYNQDNLNASDIDLGSSGPLLIPGTNLVTGGGKQGVLYLVNRDNMGHYAGPNGPDNVVQSFQASNGWILGSPVYWASTQGSLVYVWGRNDILRAYRFANGLFNTTPQALGSTVAPMPGGILSLSANGSDPSTGILWVTQGISSANQATVKGILHAYDASNVGVELWNTTLNSTRDDPGNFAKFNPPTVVNGKVYLATFSNQLVVYGLLPPEGFYFPIIIR